MFLQGTGELWSLIFIGPAIQFACLTLSGIVALYTKPLPRWNVLPVIAGLWFAFRFLVYAITGNWPEDNSAMSMIDVTFILLQVAALVALGYILKSDVPEETAAPA